MMKIVYYQQLIIQQRVIGGLQMFLSQYIFT